MSLSLKAELDTWAAALEAYDKRDFEQALQHFERISDSSKILTNMGLIYATIGEHETAVQHFVAATHLDAYLAIAHFQCGVSNFLLERYDLALVNFEDAHLYLRGNQAINYEQIGLKFKLFSAEILFNKGLAQMNLGLSEGMANMQEASRQKVIDEHGVIDEAIRNNAEGYTVFSIPVGVLYRPSENKLKNSKSKDYLGKAKLVAASDANDAFTEFTGVVKRRQASGDGEDKLAVENESTTGAGTEPATVRATDLERSNTAPQFRAEDRPDTAIVLASRRTQSVSNPAPSLTLGLSRSHMTLRRPSPGVAPLKTRASRVTLGVGAGSPRAGAETGSVASGATVIHPRRPPVQGIPQVVHQSVPLPLPQSLQPSQYVNVAQDVAASVLPAAQPLAPGGEIARLGHFAQFYDAYVEAYTDEPASQLAFPLPPTTSVLQRWPSVASSHQPPQPLPLPRPQEQQHAHAWMQSAPSSARTSSNTGSSSAVSRVPSRAPSRGANVGAASGVSKGDVGHSGGTTPHRKTSRRKPTRRATAYDDNEGEGDDGFVEGDHDDLEMAQIRVKLHYQGDVRGMMMPPTTSLSAFIERITAKFGTSHTGLGFKFVDEDGTRISLRDESDFELAIETARGGAVGRSEGKMEVWCVDVPA